MVLGIKSSISLIYFFSSIGEIRKDSLHKVAILQEKKRRKLILKQKLKLTRKKGSNVRYAS